MIRSPTRRYRDRHSRSRSFRTLGNHQRDSRHQYGARYERRSFSRPRRADAPPNLRKQDHRPIVRSRSRRSRHTGNHDLQAFASKFHKTIEDAMGCVEKRFLDKITQLEEASSILNTAREEGTLSFVFLHACLNCACMSSFA